MVWELFYTASLRSALDAVCRYVHYYADVVHHGLPRVQQLQLRRVTVSGLSENALDDLVVTVKLRPPGAGWDTELVCLAAMKPQEHFLNGMPDK